MAKSQESFMFTVGKLDAGMAILLGERAHLIEFPSVLLPPGATTGSIVNISVQQNTTEERKRDLEFWSLQNDILEAYGHTSPSPPNLEVRNVTQTSVTLEWPTINLATAKLRSLDIYKNGQRLAAIPNAVTNTSTKLSSLQLDTEYTFQLIMRTTAGTYPSNLIRVRTHTIVDTSGISVCFGTVQDPALLENAKLALGEMRAKWSDKIQIDTTHFVCTTPAATPNGAQATGGVSSGPGVEYQRALQLSIPVVQPHWILACLSEKRMVPIAGFYLGTTPSTPMNSAPFQRPQSMSQASLPQSASSSNINRNGPNRASMPAPQRVTPASPPATLNGRPHPTSPETSARSIPLDATPEEDHEDESPGGMRSPTDSAGRKSRSGTMDKNFKFPPSNTSPPASVSEAPKPKPDPPSPPGLETTGAAVREAQDGELTPISFVVPSSVEVPPPPPVEKEKPVQVVDDGEEEVGETEEIALN